MIEGILVVLVFVGSICGLMYGRVNDLFWCQVVFGILTSMIVISWISALVRAAIAAHEWEGIDKRITRVQEKFPNTHATVLPTGVLWLRDKTTHSTVIRLSAGEW